MPRTKSHALPQLNTYAKGGRKYARVALPMADGSRVSVPLGLAGDDALDRYHRTVARWLASGRTWSPAGQTKRPPTSITMGQLGERYLEHARSYYVKPDAEGNMRITDTARNITRAVELLHRAPQPDHPQRSLASMPVADFGPIALDAYRVWLAAEPRQRWGRRTINLYAGWVVQMIRHGVARELCTASRLAALEAVSPLKRGRAPGVGVAVPREGKAVPPVDAEHVAATAAKLSPTLGRAVQLHALTGMRIVELLELRISHLYHPDGRRLWPTELESDPPAALLYHVPEHADKTAHHESRPGRRVLIGPVGRGLIWDQMAEARMISGELDRELEADAAVFSPIRAEAARHLARRSTAIECGRRVRSTPLRGRSDSKDTYTRSSYRQAIRRAAEAAGVPLWSPNQLRHTAATAIANAESLHVAQALLGHSDLATTRRYVDDELGTLLDAAARHG